MMTVVPILSSVTCVTTDQRAHRLTFLSPDVQDPLCASGRIFQNCGIMYGLF